VEDAADRARGIEGGEHTDIVTAAQKLLGQSLDVPVYASLVRPGIWRDKTDSHGP
jgi:hypothetical protein